MPENLSDLFWIATTALMGDFLIFGTLGLESQIGHGSIWNPELG